LSELAACDFILVADHPVTAAHIAAAPRLKMIQHQGVGYERIDLDACRARGIPVALTPEGTSIAVAEHTILLILALYKQLVTAASGVRAGRWLQWALRDQSFELCGKTLGIVGLGNIGKKVARRAVAFDMTVQYYDLARLTEDQDDAMGVRFVLFGELLRTSDVVSLHVPLDDRTRTMMSTREFAMMKSTAILINTCRGPVVDEAALYRALTEGQIAGAGLDVMTEEPPAPNHPLFALPNVTLTPHSAGPTWENWTARLRNGFDNIQRVAAGGRPLWVIPELAQSRA
jgi:phosphoglycerate dehydrogenase-like enzyme